MKRAVLLTGFALALLLAGPAALATTYTHLLFNVSPSSLPQGGSTNIILGTQDNSNPPPGGNNFQCNTPCTFPYVPPGPACPASQYVSYTVAQLKVTTPDDPTKPDVYMLGTTSGPGISGSPIVVTTGPVSVPYGPESAPFTIGATQYEWWRISSNGNPVSPNQNIIAYPSPGPTSLPGTYTIDVEGTMQCLSGTSDFTQNFFFDIGFQITTPEFGSMIAVVAIASLALVLFKRKALGQTPLPS